MRNHISPGSKLKKMTVRGLFDLFNYEIKITQHERTTIIFGRNGTGKTTLLKVLDAISNCDLEYLVGVPFETVVLEFDFGNVTLEKQIPNEANAHQPEKEPVSTEGTTKLSFTFTPSDKYLDASDQSSRFDLTERKWEFKHLETSSGSPENFASRKQEIRHLLEILGLRCHYIAAQRLVKETSDGKQELAVVAYSNDLADRINSAYEWYSREAEARSRNFPHRVLDDLEWEYADVTRVLELSEEISKLEQSRNELALLGLLPASEIYSPIDPERVPDYDVEQAMTSFLICFFRNYVDDERAKIERYARLRARTKVLINFANAHLNRKKLSIRGVFEDAFRSSSAGSIGAFVLKDEKSRVVPLSKLSSGEQHFLTWTYELIFMCDDVDLVIIDEPELSLHVEWQLGFIKGLDEIAGESGPRFILATHSPAIVDERWELAVKLDDQID